MGKLSSILVLETIKTSVLPRTCSITNVQMNENNFFYQSYIPQH